MSRASSALRDLKALGTSAPLRAVYEASKRSGFHSLLFREIRDEGLESVSIGLGSVVPNSDQARARCLKDAAQVLTEGTRVFGTRAPTGVHASWNADPLTGSVWPEHPHWWEIDIRTDERLSDVKWVWEVARHRDLVVLARAARIDPAGPWARELQVMLEAWLEQCRPERGVNWYSSLELALRAIAWAQVLELAGPQLSAPVRAGMAHQLVASARHIMVELPYTVSSMKNNHLLGDGLGLVVLGKMFPQHSAARRWRRVGDALFMKQLRRHMRADGAMIEDSLSYHRFVLEMLIVRVIIGDAPDDVGQAMAAAAENLRQLGALNGSVPQFGDWDEGRVLADSARAGSVAGAAWAALGLAGYEVPDAKWDEYDELAWYLRPSMRRDAQPLSRLAPVRSAGYFQVVEHGPWEVWFKHATGPSHQHADLTSVWVKRDGEWITQDPGTGTYNGPLEVRNGFRTSAAHPVWRPEGGDQLVPHRAFRWLASPRIHAADPVVSKEAVALFAWHDAFVSTSGRVARLVLIDSTTVAIRDFVERPCPGVITIPLAPGASRDVPWGLDAASEWLASASPFAGWSSETYGGWAPSAWLELPTYGVETVWGLGIPAEGDATIHWNDTAVVVDVNLGGVPVTLEVDDV